MGHGDGDGRDRGRRRHDLTLSRIIDAPRPLVWQAWTEPERLKRWFAPAPIALVECEVDLRPGGVFGTLMRAPDGTEYPGNGCFLEVVEPRRLVFTDALQPGWRPAVAPFFTAIITFEEQAERTLYTARALHKDEVDRDKHERMGFIEGWGQCADQLATLLAEMKSPG